jgi:ribosome assembly protein YihI (activator of Der GTPase)
MTYQQSLELAELEADIAYEKYLEAFEADEHPEIVEQLNVEASIARHRYYEAYSEDLAH